MSTRIATPFGAALLILLISTTTGCRSLDSSYGSVPCSNLPDARTAIDCANARRERDEAYQRERERAKARTDGTQTTR